MVVVCVFLVFSFGIDTSTHTHTHIYIEKLLPLLPCIPGSPTTMSQDPGTQFRHTVPPYRGRPS
jgi:hypothetical protein